MTTTIIGVFDDALQARRAMEALRDSPIPLDDVSIVTRQTDSGAAVSDSDDVSAGEGAAVGAVWGGLVGLGALLIPGIGPFIAGGALFAALTGAVTGAVVGGITAALVDFGGLTNEEAAEYEAMVKEGKTLVAAKSSDEDAVAVRRMLVEQGADSMRENELDGATTSAVTVPTSTVAATPTAPLSAVSTSATASPPRVAMYDSKGGRVERGVDAASTGTRTTTSNVETHVHDTADTWTSGAVAGEEHDATAMISDAPMSLPPTTTDNNLPDPIDPSRGKM